MANALKLTLWCVSVVLPLQNNVNRFGVRFSSYVVCLAGWLKRQAAKEEEDASECEWPGNENEVSSLQRPRERGGVDCQVILLTSMLYSTAIRTTTAIHLRGSLAPLYRHPEDKCTSRFKWILKYNAAADAIQWRTVCDQERRRGDRASVVLLSSHVGVKLNWNTHNIQRRAGGSGRIVRNWNDNLFRTVSYNVSGWLTTTSLSLYFNSAATDHRLRYDFIPWGCRRFHTYLLRRWVGQWVPIELRAKCEQSASEGVLFCAII